MDGLSKIGIISFAIALVAGKKRVPKPPAGITAFLICCLAIIASLIILSLS